MLVKMVPRLKMRMSVRKPLKKTGFDERILL